MVLTSGTPAAALALGNLIGDVVVRQASRPGRKRPFLRGEFVLQARNFVRAINGPTSPETSHVQLEQVAAIEKITIDFVEAGSEVRTVGPGQTALRKSRELGNR